MCFKNIFSEKRHLLIILGKRVSSFRRCSYQLFPVIIFDFKIVIFDVFETYWAKSSGEMFHFFFFFFLKGNNGDEYLWFGICLTTCSLPSIKEIFFSRVRMLALWLWQLEREKERDVLATPTAKLNSFLKISVK